MSLSVPSLRVRLAGLSLWRHNFLYLLVFCLYLPTSGFSAVLPVVAGYIPALSRSRSGSTNTSNNVSCECAAAAARPDGFAGGHQSSSQSGKVILGLFLLLLLLLLLLVSHVGCLLWSFSSLSTHTLILCFVSPV